MQGIIGCKYAIESTASSQNLTCYVINKDSEIVFCKNTMQFVLYSGRRKCNTITKNYATTIPKAHGATGRYNNSISINILRDDIETFIKLVVNK